MTAEKVLLLSLFHINSDSQSKHDSDGDQQLTKQMLAGSKSCDSNEGNSGNELDETVALVRLHCATACREHSGASQ